MEFEIRQGEFKEHILQAAYTRGGTLQLPRDISVVVHALLEKKFSGEVEELLSFFKHVLGPQICKEETDDAPSQKFRLWKDELMAALEHVRKAVRATDVVFSLQEHTPKRLSGKAQLNPLPDMDNRNMALLVQAFRAKELEIMRMRHELSMIAEKEEWEDITNRLRNFLATGNQQLGKMKAKKKGREKESSRLRREELEKQIKSAKLELQTALDHVARKNLSLHLETRHSLASLAGQVAGSLGGALAHFNLETERYLQTRGIKKEDIDTKKSAAGMYSETCVLHIADRSRKPSNKPYSIKLQIAALLAAALGASLMGIMRKNEETVLTAPNDNLKEEVTRHLEQNPIQVELESTPAASNKTLSMTTAHLLPHAFLESRPDLLLRFTLEFKDGKTFVLGEEIGETRHGYDGYFMEDPVLEAFQNQRFFAEILYVAPDGSRTRLMVTRQIRLVFRNSDLP